MAFWKDHSLTIVLAALGVAFTGAAFFFDEGKVFDLVLGIGQSILTTGAVFFLSQYFRETTKPED
jgi:hypothetical protein